MKFMTFKIKIMMLSVIFLGLALMVVVDLANVCPLEAVTMDNKPVKAFEEKFCLEKSKSLFDQPLDSLARALLARQDIIQVEVDYELPRGLNITTNNLEPVCYVVDRVSGELYGLDNCARVIKAGKDILDWEMPVLTNVQVERLYAPCPDYRVNLIVVKLEKFRDEHLDLFRLINEIDLENTQYALVSLSGLPFRLKLRAEDFFRQFNVFVKFVENYETDFTDVKMVDLRFDDMIITVGEDT